MSYTNNVVGSTNETLFKLIYVCVFFFCYFMYNVLGDIVTLCIYCQSRTILLSDKHNYIDFVFFFLFLYSTLLLVSSVHISHHQVRHWFTKK
jgi:hypothetical protein